MKHMNDLKNCNPFIYNSQMLLLLHQVRYLYSDVPRITKHLVFYGNIITLQIFVKEVLRLTIFYVAVTAPAYNTGSLYCQIYLKMQFLMNKIMLVKRARCASSSLAINTCATFCSYYHFFQTKRQMSTIKLMAASLV